MIDKLENIGFYTLCDDRARNANSTFLLWRGEIVITDRCNFSCPYCREMRKDCQGDMNIIDASALIKHWTALGLKHIRFSGGEPTLHSNLEAMIKCAKREGIERIAISTNGSADIETYFALHSLGVDDFSISLDSCCSSFAHKMAGTDIDFDRIVNNIRILSKLTYVTIGIVITDDNAGELLNLVEFAHGLGVADIRIISAAQYNKLLKEVVEINDEILESHPILKYRVNNIKNGINVRGIKKTDCHMCHLLYDDVMVAGGYYFPCIIYFRESGEPICKRGGNAKESRKEWIKNHDPHNDPICKSNCLDVCIDYNNRFEQLRTGVIENEN